MFLTFESADIILWCDYSNETFLAVRSHGTYLFYSAFYKTKLLCRISTLVNFASERGKTLFSGGTRGRGLGDPPPYFQINQTAPGKRKFFSGAGILPLRLLSQGPDDLGPLLSHLRFCLFRFPILYNSLIVSTTRQGILR